MSRLSVLLAVFVAAIAILGLIVRQQQQSNDELRSEISQLEKQLQEERNERRKGQNQFIAQCQEVRNELKQVKRDMNILQSKYAMLKEKFLEDKKETINRFETLLSLQTRLRMNVTTDMEELEARTDSRIDTNEKKNIESQVALVNLFVAEISEWKNKTLSHDERLQQLESRERIMIENKVVVEREYHVQTVEPQMTLGERIGRFFGGAIEEEAKRLTSAALRLLGM